MNIPNMPFPFGAGTLFTTADPADFTNAYRPAVVSALGDAFTRVADEVPFATTMVPVTSSYTAQVRWLP